jgi:hypothetical protein
MYLDELALDTGMVSRLDALGPTRRDRSIEKVLGMQVGFTGGRLRDSVTGVPQTKRRTPRRSAGRAVRMAA